MRRNLPVYLACGASLGVIIAYLIAGGASYKPLRVADPCQPRPLSILAERGVFEGIALSALDGAACELEVSREALTAALADQAALDAFATENGVGPDQVEAAVRAGLIRAVGDAERAGLIGGPVAAVAGLLAENAPVGTVIALFTALPGDPSLTELLTALNDFGVGLGRLRDLGLGALDDLGSLGPDLRDALPDELKDLLPP